MNLRDLQAFVAVAETGSVSRAALRLHLTQPAITRRIQNFESALGGVALVDRSAKPLALTPTGRQVLAHCRDVQTALVALKSGVLVKGDPLGELRMGVGAGTEAILGAPLEDLRRRFPRVELCLSTNWTARLIEGLAHGSLDLAVAYVTRDHAIPATVKAAVIGSEDIVVVASRNLELKHARRKRLRIRDVAAHRWVLNPVGCAYRLAVQRAHDAAGVPLQLAAEVTGRDLQLSLVASGVGLGLLSQRAFDKGAYRRTLRVVPLEDFQLQSAVTVLRAGSIGNFGTVAELLEKRLTQELRHKRPA